MANPISLSNLINNGIAVTKLWGENAITSVSEVVKNTATQTVDFVKSTAIQTGKAFNDTYEEITDAQNTTTAQQITTAQDKGSYIRGVTFKNQEQIIQSPGKISGTEPGELFMIGRPCKFNSDVDKFQRFGNYLRMKMNVVDLIPVDYSMDIKNMWKMMSEETRKTFKDSIYSLNYGGQIEVYKRICNYHGLKKYSGIRLFTTDDTTANDTISVQYKDSTFQGVADQLTDIGQKVRNVASTVFGSKASDVLKTGSTELGNVVRGTGNELGASQGVQDLLGTLTEVVSDMGLNGNKLTFPKIWQSSSYAGNLSVNIRLVSPYGHPNAIKEFIMKPLSYLILLAAPQTTNSITYGGNIPITIKAYGMNYTTLGAISSMTFRRGGSDTSYNLYRQPLTIDVSLEFQTLFDAFAVFDPLQGDNLTTDQNIFNDPQLTNVSPYSLDAYTRDSQHHYMTTLGTILASLRPIQISGFSVNPQVYGSFIAPSRDDVPDDYTFIPLTGNLGSAISGAVSSIGNFANMVTNAPKIAQQALSNAVYNMSKGAVSTITGTASGWLNAASSRVNDVVNTVNMNIF